VLWVEQVLGVLTFVHIQPDHLAGWASNQQLARQLCGTAAQFDNLRVLLQVDQRLQQVEFVGYQ